MRAAMRAPLAKTAGAVSQKIGFMSAECACGSTGADVVGLGCFLHCFAFGLHVWPAGGGLSLEQVESPAGAALTSGGTTAAPELEELGYTCAGDALTGGASSL